MPTGHQLGVLRNGFEIGVHAIRELEKSAERDEAILLLDFRNALNSNRNLLLGLAALCPEDLAARTGTRPHARRSAH